MRTIKNLNKNKKSWYFHIINFMLISIISQISFSSGQQNMGYESDDLIVYQNYRSQFLENSSLAVPREEKGRKRERRTI